MAEPIQLKGYGRFQDAYSGQVAGKPRGLLPNVEPIVAFRYRHVIIRNIPIDLSGKQGNGGFWTIQIRESGAENARILFEQSVLIAPTLFEWLGLVTGWYVAESYLGKFKTRICNGEHVPPVIEPMPDGHEETEPGDDMPAVPGVPLLFNVRVTSLSVKMPELPENGKSFTLLASRDRFGDYVAVKEDMKPDDVVDVDVVANLGIVSLNQEVAPTEMVWWKLRAVGDNGFTDGPAIRDIWTHQAGVELDTGYQGYLYADRANPSVYYEQANTYNESASPGFFSVQLNADWVSPAYKCSIPPGAYLKIISDFWVGHLADDNIYYALSYKAGGVAPQTIHNPHVGTVWTFGVREGKVQCTRSRRLENHQYDTDGGTVYDGAASFLCPLHHGHVLYCLMQIETSVRLGVSHDAGVHWEETIVIATGVTMLAGQISEDGGTFFIYGKATANDKDVKKDDLVRVVARLDRDGVKVMKEKMAGDGLPEARLAGMLRAGNTLFIPVAESDGVRLFSTENEMREWKELEPVTDTDEQG